MKQRFCRSCKAILITKKERILGTCDKCGLEAHKGFEMMGKGDFKLGFKKVFNVRFANDKDRIKQVVLEAKIKKALKRKEKLIVRKLAKKGLSPAEIEEGLKKLKED
jgi:DNA-directed RNA polymerase subunit M/transcription elongation factor TFIIS